MMRRARETIREVDQEMRAELSGLGFDNLKLGQPGGVPEYRPHGKETGLVSCGERLGT
jgi:hypothetical protein